MKALILTNYEVTQKERYLIECSSVLKIAVNWAWYLADYRVAQDQYYEDEILSQFSEQLIQYSPFPIQSRKKRITIDHTLWFSYGSITTAISLAIQKGCEDILLVADNTIHQDKFKQGIKDAVNVLKSKANIYQCSNGNFELPTISIQEFLR